MNAVIDTQQEWIRNEEEFYAPSSFNALDILLNQYQKERSRVLEIAEQIRGEDCMRHFIEGNSENRHWSPHSIDKLFCPEGAIAHLNSDYWGRALALTDVIECMPQDRRNEWFDQIREQKCPDFEESTVTETLRALLSSRKQFFAERVDGIFRSLSGEHVTNSPMGFRKRMIISGIFSFYVETRRSGYIHDLRIIIAKFMGLEVEPHWESTNQAIRIARRRHGEWIKLDGGALKLRVYLKGTAHLEVHPDMAWRLNCVLANLYPHAIPEASRKRPAKKAKNIDLIQKPLPFLVLSKFHEYFRHLKNNQIDAPPHFYDESKFIRKQAIQIVELIGGVRQENGSFQFSYDPREVVDEIFTSGCIPDHVSYQYYPTPENIASEVIEMAEIGPDHLCLEPSAGQGGLSDFMPKERTDCIEISSLHCKILEAKGYRVTEGDFLKIAARPQYDRIVMNPPFSDGRWQAHIAHAFDFLKPGGKMVAIVPVSAAGKELIQGGSHEYSRVYDNEFRGTSISVVAVKITSNNR